MRQIYEACALEQVVLLPTSSVRCVLDYSRVVISREHTSDMLNIYTLEIASVIDVKRLSRERLVDVEEQCDLNAL